MLCATMLCTGMHGQKHCVNGHELKAEVACRPVPAPKTVRARSCCAAHAHSPVRMCKTPAHSHSCSGKDGPGTHSEASEDSAGFLAMLPMELLPPPSSSPLAACMSASSTALTAPHTACARISCCWIMDLRGVRACVCVCMCVCACACVCVCARAYVCMYVYMYVCMHACVSRVLASRWLRWGSASGVLGVDLDLSCMQWVRGRTRGHKA